MTHAVESIWSGTAPCEAEDGPSEPMQRTLPEPTAASFRRQGEAAVEDALTPPREARSTDASRLTFPVQMLIAAVLMTASIIGAVYGMTGGIRESQLRTESDMRDLRTRMEYQQRVNEADARAQSVVFDNMKTTVEQLRAQVQLLQLQYAELNKQIRGR